MRVLRECSVVQRYVRILAVSLPPPPPTSPLPPLVLSLPTSLPPLSLSFYPSPLPSFSLSPSLSPSETGKGEEARRAVKLLNVARRVFEQTLHLFCSGEVRPLKKEESPESQCPSAFTI